MNQDIESLRNAWSNLNSLVASMSCGCRIEEEPPYTLDLVALKCREFLEEYVRRKRQSTLRQE